MIDWKNVVVNTLKSYSAMKIALNNIPAEIDLINHDIQTTEKEIDKGLSLASISEMQLSRKILIKKLESRLQTTKNAVSDIDTALEALNEEEKQILTEFFVNNVGKRLADIGDELGYSLATMYRKKDAALWRFAIRLYGIEAG